MMPSLCDHCGDCLGSNEACPRHGLGPDEHEPSRADIVTIEDEPPSHGRLDVRACRPPGAPTAELVLLRAAHDQAVEALGGGGQSGTLSEAVSLVLRERDQLREELTRILTKAEIEIRRLGERVGFFERGHYLRAAREQAAKTVASHVEAAELAEMSAEFIGGLKAAIAALRAAPEGGDGDT